MRNRGRTDRSSERGVTIVVVAITLVALVAMAALAIDISTLYVARREAQRAADAAALAGAKMFVTSGYTSVQGNGTPPVTQDQVCQTGAPTLPAAANLVAAAVAAQNLIAGQSATVQKITCDFTAVGNPKITVTIQRTDLPTFFARIWGSTVSSVGASATAEVYNQSAIDTPPVQVTSVKPWLVPNCNPSGAGGCPAAAGAGYFVDTTTGKIANNGTFIGTTISLNGINSGAATGSNNTLTFYRLRYPTTPAPVCPSAASASCGGPPAVGSNNYLDDIACSSQVQFSCGMPIGSGQTVQVQTGGTTLTSETLSGTRCLIHAESDDTSWPGPITTSEGQDSFLFPDGLGKPAEITAGDNNPNPTFVANPENISRSDSVVTVPLYDGSQLCTTGRRGSGCTVASQVIGFLQLGITRTIAPVGTPTPPQVEGVVLNAVGCSPTAVASYSAAPASVVTGGGISPIPVRLIRGGS
jgi:Putative Flp pilus-assembly TadE/G-like